jgi:hypothetical protein
LIHGHRRGVLDDSPQQLQNATEPVISLTPALRVTAPKREEMDPEEDVELLGVDEARIQLTKRAVEARGFVAFQTECVWSSGG